MDDKDRARLEEVERALDEVRAKLAALERVLGYTPAGR